MFSAEKPVSLDTPEVVRVEYIRPYEIRSESEGFFTLVEAGTMLSDDGVLTYRAIGVQNITQKSIAYVMERLGLTTESQVLHMLMDHEIGVERRRDGRDRISSDPKVNPWMRNYIWYRETSPE